MEGPNWTDAKGSGQSRRHFTLWRVPASRASGPFGDRLPDQLSERRTGGQSEILRISRNRIFPGHRIRPGQPLVTASLSASASFGSSPPGQSSDQPFENGSPPASAVELGKVFPKFLHWHARL